MSDTTALRQRVTAALSPTGWPVYGVEDREKYAGHDRDGMSIEEGEGGKLVLRPVMGGNSYEYFDEMWVKASEEGPEDFELEPLYAQNDREQLVDAFGCLTAAGIAAEIVADGNYLEVTA